MFSSKIRLISATGRRICYQVVIRPDDLFGFSPFQKGKTKSASQRTASFAIKLSCWKTFQSNG
jgi:hypothetical protein